MTEELTFKPVATRALLVRQAKNKAVNFQASVFQEQKKSTDLPSKSKVERIFPAAKRTARTNGSALEETEKSPLEFNIKKARHEVLNFAINNQHNEKLKRKMQIFQAVKLGAKPPRKRYKNYKDLVDERKRLKTIREERKKYHQLGKNQVGLASIKCKSSVVQKSKRPPVTSISKHYGVVNPKFKKNK